MAKSKKTYWIVFTGLLAIAGYAFYRFTNLKNASNYLRYKLSSPKLSDFTFNDFKITFTLQVLNDSTETFQFKSFIGVIIYKGNEVANFTTSQTQQVKILPKSSINIPIALYIKYTSLLDLAESIFYKSKKQAFNSPIVIKGLITVGNIQIPVNQTFSLK